jgi:hypothetical protein
MIIGKYELVKEGAVSFQAMHAFQNEMRFVIGVIRPIKSMKQSMIYAFETLVHASCF